MNHLSRLGTAAALLTFPLALGAQEPVAPEPAAQEACQPGSAHGVGWVDDQLLGGGLGYAAEFDPDGIKFTVALGDEAPRAYPVHFALRSVSRRGGETWQAAAAERRLAGDTVHYRRDGYVESYAVGDDELEQSFTFDVLPGGTGDLVVRLAVTTDLAAQPVAASYGGDVVFSEERLGGVVRVGEVVGIDANGSRARGWTSYADGVLELGLPAEFVDRARLPLVLDPPIGSRVTIAGSTSRDPDVSYDGASQTYLVVWQQFLSSTTRRVLGRRVDRFGQPFGSLLALSPVTGYSLGVAVANVTRRTRHVVVWTDGDDSLWARSVDAFTGAMSSAIFVAGSVGDFDIGGDAVAFDDDAVVVFSDNDARDIFGAQIEVGSTGALRVHGGRLLSAGGSNELRIRVAISRVAGPGGRFLVVYDQINGPPWSPYRLRGVVISRDVFPLDTVVLPSPTSQHRWFPHVDGDGTNWIVAYNRSETTTFSNNDVVCAAVTFHPRNPSGTTVGPEVVVEGHFNDPEYTGAVSWSGESCLVTFADYGNSGQNDLYAKAVDLFTGRICGPEYGIEVGTSINSSALIAAVAQRSTNTLGEEVMIVWEGDNLLGRTVYAQRWLTDDGVVTELGGGCGRGGTAAVSCAVAGNSSFALRLQNAEPLAATAVLVSASRADISCGPCTLVPNLFGGYAVQPVAGTTDAVGDAAVSLPIPSFAQGAELYVQWVTAMSPAQCNSFLTGADLSSALQVRVQ